MAGAELNAYWYMRNAKIFSKLMTASRPGDRIVVVLVAGTTLVTPFSLRRLQDTLL